MQELDFSIDDWQGTYEYLKQLKEAMEDETLTTEEV
jgi:hypothetical protein